VVGEEPELGEPEAEAPVSVEPLGAPGVPGMGPHGEPPGVVPGVAEVFGLTVEGCVALPGVGGFGEFDPGTVDGEVGGFTAPVGGATGVLVGGGAGVAGGGALVCPADPELPAGAPPEGALWATTHVAPNRMKDRNIDFLATIGSLQHEIVR